MNWSKFCGCSVIGILTCSLLGASPEFSAAERQVAAEYLELSGVRQSLNRTIEQLLNTQQKAIPNFARYRPVFAKYYRKIYGFEALKPDLIQMHLQYYTLAELRQLIAFYRTPIGRKKAATDGEISRLTAEITAQKSRQVLKELQKDLAAVK